MDGLDVKLEQSHDHVRDVDVTVLTFKALFSHPEARRIHHDTNFVVELSPRIKHAIDNLFEEYLMRLDMSSSTHSQGGDAQTPPAQFTSTHQLGRSRRVVHLEHFAGKECSVCQSTYLPNEFVRTLPVCKHMFHKRCIDPWIKRNQNPTCPVCRTHIIHTSSARSESHEPERPTLE
jgi:hypothetical protein